MNGNNVSGTGVTDLRRDPLNSAVSQLNCQPGPGRWLQGLVCGGQLAEGLGNPEAT